MEEFTEEVHDFETGALIARVTVSEKGVSLNVPVKRDGEDGWVPLFKADWTGWALSQIYSSSYDRPFPPPGVIKILHSDHKIEWQSETQQA